MLQKFRPTFSLIAIWLVLKAFDEIVFQSTRIVAGTHCWVSSNGNLFVYDNFCAPIRVLGLLLYNTSLITIFIIGAILAHQVLKNSNWVKILAFIMAIWVYPDLTGKLYKIQFWIRNYGVWMFLAMVIILSVVSYDKTHKNYLGRVWDYFTDRV